MKTTEAIHAEAVRGLSGRVSRWLAQGVVALAGVLNLLTGVALLFAPVWFFQHIGTFGPFNRHYEGDLGAFLLALGIGLLFAARSPSRYGLVIWVAAIGSLLHACNHIYDAIVQGASLGQWLAQPVPLFVLAFLLIWAASQGGSVPKEYAHSGGAGAHPPEARTHDSASARKGARPMYARVVTIQLQPGKMDEAVRIYRDSVIPLINQQQGFQGMVLLTDPNTGKGISIGLWKTEADLKAVETSGFYQEQIVKFAQVLAAPPTREVYEVSVQV